MSEATETGQDHTITVTFDYSCEEIDGVRVLHDGEVVWQDSSEDVGQYLMHFAPKTPVFIEVQR